MDWLETEKNKLNLINKPNQISKKNVFYDIYFFGKFKINYLYLIKSFFGSFVQMYKLLSSIFQNI